MKKAALVLFMLFVGIMYGCASTSGDKNLSNLTYSEASRVFIAGKTTKNDVLSRLGQPRYVTSTNGEDCWIYEMSTQSSSNNALTRTAVTMGNTLMGHVTGHVIGAVAGELGAAAAVGSSALLSEAGTAVTAEALSVGEGSSKCLVIYFDRNDRVRDFVLNATVYAK